MLHNTGDEAGDMELEDAAQPVRQHIRQTTSGVGKLTPCGKMVGMALTIYLALPTPAFFNRAP